MKKTIIGFSIGLGIALLLTLFAGENPLNIFLILIKSAFGSRYDLGLTLFYTTPLIFTGLSVAIAFHAGLFNIGAEGQLLIGTISCAAFGILFPTIPFPIAPFLSLIFAILMASAWGFLAGWLRAVRGSHEVIVTIMMNFIAAGITSWITLSLIPNPNSQNPETAVINKNYMLKSIDFVSALFPESPVSLALVFAIALSIGVWFFLNKTTLGFELKAVGQNPEAAERAGISKQKIQILAMTLAGALAGFVASSEVIGSSGQFKIGFSPDYGFLGIAVALLAQNNPIGILPAAFLIGALHKGASDLDLETATITRDFSKIIQALIILGVSSQGFGTWLKSKFKKQKGTENV